MNPIRLFSIVAAAGLPAWAIEAPEDKALPPPEAVAQERNAPSPQSTPSPDPEADRLMPTSPPKAGAFLGVISGEVPDLLAEHLGIAAGGGVVIRSLAPEGPAAHAGLAVNDLIIRVAGNAVSSPSDLSREISRHRAGDIVRLDVIRKGNPSTLDVKLAARPDAVRPQPAPQDATDPSHADWSERLNRMIEKRLGEFGLRPDSGNGIAPGDELQEAIDRMRHRMERLMGPLITPDAVPEVPQWQGQLESSASIRMLDAQGSVEIRSVSGATEAIVRDGSDRVVWSGPWETDQDKAAAPADVRTRIERLPYKLDLKGSGFNMRLGSPEKE
jgi:hypothetical protein